MKNFDKYEKAYFMPPECTYDWVKKDSSQSLRFGVPSICVMVTRR